MVEFSRSERLMLEALQIEDSPSGVDAARVRSRVLMGAGVAAAAGAATTTAVEAAVGSSPVAAPAAATALSASTTTIATGVASSGATTAALGASGAAATTGSFGLLKALLAVGGVTALGGGAIALSWQHAEPTVAASVPGEQPEPAERREPAGQRERAVGQAARQASEGTARDTVAPEPVVTTTPRVPQRVQSAPDPKSTLKEEAAILSRAQAALQRGDVAGAMAALSEHRDKFPRGVLRGEREAALSVAYCKSGDPRGRQRAERFISKNPDSPMVQRLRWACKLPKE